MIPDIPGNIIPESDEILIQLRRQVGALLSVSGSRYEAAEEEYKVYCCHIFILCSDH